MNSHDKFLDKKFREVSNLIQHNSIILDIGCNNAKLKDFLHECKYYGVDIDKDLISSLNKRNINARKVDLNKEEIPFKGKKFNYILMLDLLEHVINPAKLLSDSKKRLTIGGRIIVTLPNDYHLLNKIRFLFNKPLTADPFAPYGHLHFFSINVGESFLKKQKFKIIIKKPLSPPKPSFIPEFLLEFLTFFFPQSFARDILYVLETED